MRKLNICLAYIFILSSILLTTKAQQIPPELKKEVKSVKMTTIDNGNKDVIWALRENPDRAEILKLKLYGEDLSTGQIEVIKEWLQNGRGVVIFSANSNSEVPKVKTNRVLNSILGEKVKITMMEPREAVTDFYASSSSKSHPLLKNVNQVTSSYSYGSGDYNLPYTVERSRETTFTSILETKSGSTVAAAWSLEGNGGRVLYCGVDPEYPFERFKDEYDNQRFIANYVMWLSGRR